MNTSVPLCYNQYEATHNAYMYDTKRHEVELRNIRESIQRLVDALLDTGHTDVIGTPENTCLQITKSTDDAQYRMTVLCGISSTCPSPTMCPIGHYSNMMQPTKQTFAINIAWWNGKDFEVVDFFEAQE